MPERRVVDHDVFLLDALRFQIGFQNLVGGARIDVVGAREHPALHRAAVLAHQIVDSRDRLLVRRGAGVEDVVFGLFAFVLHRIEQDRVELLEHRQHGLARHRRPAAEHHGDLVLGDQFARLFGEQRPVRGRIDDDGFELLAVDTTLLVLLVDHEQHGVLQRRFADGHGARERVQNADLDRVLRLRGRDCSRDREGKPGGGGEPLAGSRPSRGRMIRCEHSLRPLRLTRAFSRDD